MTDELRGTGSLWFDEDDNNSNNADSPSEGEASSSAEHTAQEDLPSEASASESEDEQPAARRPRAAMTKVIARPSAVERRLAGALFGLDSDDDDPDAEQDAHDYFASERSADNRLFDDASSNFIIDTSGSAALARAAGVADSDDEDADASDDQMDGEERALSRARARQRKAGSQAPLWSDSHQGAGSRRERLVASRRRDADTASTVALTDLDREQRLRQQFERKNPSRAWADLELAADRQALDQERFGSDAAALLASATRHLTDPNAAKRQRRERGGPSLHCFRVTDINRAERSEAVIRSLLFHSRSPVAVTAGFDKTVRLYEVDGRENSQLFNIHLQDFPIHRAQFTGQHSDDLMVTSRRPFYFSLDLASGKQTRIAGIMGIKEKTFELFEASPSGQFVAIVGSTTRQVHLVAGKSKLLIKTLHHNRPVVDLAFSHGDATSSAPSFGGFGLPEGDNTAGHIGIDAANTSPVLFTLTDRGQVYRWDLTTLTCTGQFTDQGTLMASQITTSPCGRIVAVSSHEGIVNLYDCGRAPSLTLDMSVRPVKTFTNLTTTIDCLEFNADASLLVFGSSVKKAQLRVVNMATQTVYDNWPRNEKALPLSRLSAVNFSPNGGYMGIADDKGRALLYRLGHSAEY